MAIVIPTGFVQVIYSFLRQGDTDPYSVVLGCENPGPLTLAQVAQLFSTAFDDNLDSQMTNTQDLVNTRAQNAIAGVDLPSAIRGAVSGATFPQNTAVLVRKLSLLRGRANQGRNYWPGFIAETGVNDVGVLTVADRAGLQTAFNAWFAQLTSGGCPLVILHDETSPVVTPTAVESLFVSETVATQRLRLRR